MLFHSVLFASFLCFIYIRAYMDYWLIEIEQVELKGNYKLCTSIITCLVSSYINLMFKGAGNIFLLLLLSYGLIFDTILNILRGKKYDYLGSGGIDSFYKLIPFQFYVRIILIIILIKSLI
jgi:hypothetical protein